MSSRMNGSALSDRPSRPSYDQRGVFPSHNHVQTQIMQGICTNSLRVETHGLKESSLQASHPSADVHSVYSTIPGESIFHMPCTFMMIMDLRNIIPFVVLSNFCHLVISSNLCFANIYRRLFVTPVQFLVFSTRFWGTTFILVRFYKFDIR